MTGGGSGSVFRSIVGLAGLGEAAVVVVSEGEEGLGTVAGIRRAVHDRECAGLELGEPTDGGRGVRREARGAEHVLGLAGGLEQVIGGERWSVPDLEKRSPHGGNR